MCCEITGIHVFSPAVCRGEYIFIRQTALAPAIPFVLQAVLKVFAVCMARHVPAERICVPVNNRLSFRGAVAETDLCIPAAGSDNTAAGCT